MSAMTDRDLIPCDCEHARHLHDEGLYACSADDCECPAFVPLDAFDDDDDDPDTEEVEIAEEDDLLEPYERDPDWWKP